MKQPLEKRIDALEIGFKQHICKHEYLEFKALFPLTLRHRSYDVKCTDCGKSMGIYNKDEYDKYRLIGLKEKKAKKEQELRYLRSEIKDITKTKTPPS